MADFNLNDDFDQHSEKSEVEKIDWDTLEEIFVSDTDQACLEVCNEISDSTSAEKAAEKLENAYKFEETENFCAPNLLETKTKIQKHF